MKNAADFFESYPEEEPFERGFAEFYKMNVAPKLEAYKAAHPEYSSRLERRRLLGLGAASLATATIGSLIFT